jgi:hypothetical protein
MTRVNPQGAGSLVLRLDEGTTIPPEHIGFYLDLDGHYAD